MAFLGGKSSYDKTDLSALFNNNYDLIGMFLKLRNFYTQYCNGLVVSGYCWNGEDIIGISIPDHPYIFYVYPHLKKIVFHNGHTLEFTYLLRDAVYRAAVSDMNGNYDFFAEQKVPYTKTRPLFKSQNTGDKKSNYSSGLSQRKPTQTFSNKSKGGKKNAFGPMVRSGGGYHDDVWAPGLPSTRMNRSSKSNDVSSGPPMRVTVDPSGIITKIEYDD